jgi:hypothetical protein
MGAEEETLGDKAVDLNIRYALRPQAARADADQKKQRQSSKKHRAPSDTISIGGLF